jgi:hypothetical protein
LIWFKFEEKILKEKKFSKASRRVDQNLRDALNSEFVNNTKLMNKIAKDLAQHGHTVPQHPLGF